MTSPLTVDDSAGDHGLERFVGDGELGAQAVEGVVLEDLAAHPLGDAVALAGPDEQDQLARRDTL